MTKKLEHDWRIIQRVNKVLSAPYCGWVNAPMASYAVYAVADAIAAGKDQEGMPPEMFIVEAMAELRALPAKWRKLIMAGRCALAEYAKTGQMVRVVKGMKFIGSPSKAYHDDLWNEMWDLLGWVEERAAEPFKMMFVDLVQHDDYVWPTLGSLMLAKASFYGLPVDEQRRILGGWKPQKVRPTTAQLQEQIREAGDGDVVQRALCIEVNDHGNEHRVNAYKQFNFNDSCCPVQVQILEGTSKRDAVLMLWMALMKVKAEFERLVGDEPTELECLKQESEMMERAEKSFRLAAEFRKLVFDVVGANEGGGVDASPVVPVLGGRDNKAGMATAA